MAEKIFKTRIKQRRDTSANWESKNPVLLNGEIIIVDTASGEMRTKTGNGTKSYTQLPFDDEGTKGGKSLSTNDYTDAEKSEVAKIKDKVNTSDVYTKSEVNEVLKNNRPSKSVPIDPSIVSELMRCGVSYLNHKEGFSFTDSGKGTLFDDDFSTESPKIDCSSFGMALIMGIPYEYSKYAGENNSKHYDYGIKLPINPYDSERPNRYYTHELAHYFDEQGWCFVPDKNYSDIAPGDIIFVSFKSRDGNSDFHDNAYMKIDHCLFVLGYKDDTHLICLHTSEQSTIHFYDVCVLPSEYDSTSTNGYNNGIKLVARLPFKPGHISEKPIFVDSTAKTTTSTTNGFLTTINLDKPLKINTTYTLIANAKNAFAQTKPSTNNYFGIRASYADGTADETIFSWAKNVYPNDNLYRCRFVTGDKEITKLKLYILSCTVSGHVYKYSALYEGSVSTTPYESDLSRNQSDIIVIDNLESTSTMSPLSANQGRILNENKVDKVEGKSLIDSTFASNIDNKQIHFQGEADTYTQETTSIRPNSIYLSNTEGNGITSINGGKISIDNNGIHTTEITPHSISLADTSYGNDIKISISANDVVLTATELESSATTTHKLSEKADSIELERIKYYGDKDIVPSSESYFTVNATGDTITGLTDEGKTQTELVIPYEINGKKIVSISGNASTDGNTSVKSIKLPNSITAIEGTAAFYGYTALSSINIPDSVTSIGLAAFTNCTSLKSINIPDSVTSMGYNVFKGSGLTSVKLPNNLTIINILAFSYCTSLTSINIPDSVTYIEADALTGCTSLTSINIPNSVTGIGNGAFNESPLLTIHCEQDSYAETYAKNNGIPIVYTDIKSTELNNKVDKVTGKSLIDENVAKYITYDPYPASDKCIHIDNISHYSEDFTSVTDFNGNIVLSNRVTTPDGSLVYWGNEMTLNSYGLSIAGVGASKPEVKISSEGIQLTQTDGGVPSSLIVTSLNSSGGDVTLVKPNEAGTSITHNLSNKSEAKTYTVSVPTTSWTEKTDIDNQKYYYKKITVSGMTASGQAMTDVAMSDSVATARKEIEAYQCVNRVVTGDGYVELYCFDEVPATAFTLRILVISNILG